MELIVFIVGAIGAAICVYVFFEYCRKSKMFVQLLLTIGFAVGSQAALYVIPVFDMAALIIFKGILIFAAAVVATVMLGMTGGLLFSILGGIATVVLVVLLFQSLPQEAQDVLATVWGYGTEPWTDWFEEVTAG